ncbi:MAG: hypothetical protein Q7O66_11320, partial [Dehalococcoidia bacterium]|nr:hypothetical protein [Dehalococcoidia bacterium]
ANSSLLIRSMSIRPGTVARPEYLASSHEEARSSREDRTWEGGVWAAGKVGDMGLSIGFEKGWTYSCVSGGFGDTGCTGEVSSRTASGTVVPQLPQKIEVSDRANPQ